MTTNDWGNHCVTADLKDTSSNGGIIESVDVCVEVPKELPVDWVKTSSRDSQNQLLETPWRVSDKT